MRMMVVGRDWDGSNVRSFAQAFQRQGNEVLLVDPFDLYRINFAFRAKSKLTRTGTKKILQLINNHLTSLARMFGPAVILVFRGLYVFPETISEFHRMNILVWHYHPDDWRYPGNSNKLFRNSIPLYDGAIVTKNFNVNEYYGLGASRVLYVTSSYDTKIHRPLTLDRSEKCKFLTDVGFIGTGYPIRRWTIKELLNRHFPVVGFRIWGTRWGGGILNRSYSGPFKDVWMGAMAIGIDYAKSVAGTSINIGFVEGRDQHTTRTFEIPACGGFMLMQRTDEQLEYFRESVEAEYWNDIEELNDKITYYLQRSAEVERIKQNAYKRSRQLPCSYDDNARKIIKEFLS